MVDLCAQRPNDTGGVESCKGEEVKGAVAAEMQKMVCRCRHVPRFLGEESFEPSLRMDRLRAP